MSHVDDLVLGQILVDRGRLTPEQLAAALDEATPRRPLSAVLVESGLLRKEEIDALATQATVKTVNKKPPLAAKARARAASPDSDVPADVAEMLKLPDYCFDKFVLIGMLGKGGMGEVWKAWQRDLRRYVAIKFLDGREEEELERFFREARMAASLSHPNITALYELNRFEGRHYIVMEFVDGVTLQSHLGRLPFARAARIIRDASLALDHAHKSGIIHRDIKPQNIMVAKNGRVYVMDFGLAKQQRDAQGNTVAGQILGTPAFMSPEQAEGKIGKMDRRTDVYSMGATLYTLVTGKQPVQGRAVVDILYKVVHGEVVPPRQLNPKIPMELEAVILKAMDKNPAGRYPSAAAFAEDIRRFLDGEPISAQPATTMTVLKRSIARHRTAVIVAAVLVIAVAVTAFAISRARTAEEKGGASAEALRRKEEELQRKELELAERQAGAKLRDALEKPRAAYVEAEKLLAMDGAEWDRVIKQAELVGVAASQVAREFPKAADPHYWRGRALALRREWGPAETAYLEAIRLDPDHAPTRLQLAWLYQFWGEDLDAARDFTGRGVSAEGESTRAKARPHLTRFLQVGTDADEKVLAEAGLLYLDGEYPKAEKMLQKLRTGGAESWELHFFIARAMRRVGRWRDMYRHLGVLARLGRNHPSVNQFGAACYLESAELSIGRPDELEKRYLEGMPFCDRHIQVLGSSATAWCQRAWLWFCLGKGEEAVKDAEKALAIDPRRPASILVRAYAALLSGDAIGARNRAEDLVKSESGLGRAHLLLGDIWLASQNPGEALRCYERATREEPALGEGYLGASRIHGLLGQPETAVEGLFAAAKADPLHYAGVYLQTLWQAIERVPPKSSEFQRLLSRLLEGGKLLADRVPYLPEPHWIYAEAMLRANDLEKALDEINIANALLPNASRLLFCRGKILMGLKRWKEAEGDVLQTTRINPDDGDALLHLGIIRMNLDRPGEAAAAFEESIRQWGPKIRGWAEHVQPHLDDARRRAGSSR